MNTCKINDSVFDALFRQAVIESVEREVQALPSEDEITDITFSERHERRMEKLFSDRLRKNHIATAVRVTRRAAVVILIVTSLLFGALMTSQDVRATVINTVVQWFEQFALFTSERADEPTAILLPSYVPEGFVEVERTVTEHSKSLLLVNDYGDMIFFSAKQIVDLLAVDHEQRGYRQTFVYGIVFHIFEAKEYGCGNTIIWEYSGNRYIINTSISVEYALEIALSVR